MRRKKKKTVDNHFSVRCLQRLGYVPNRQELVKKIQNAELEFIERQSNRVTLWRWICPITNIVCVLPYDKERKQLITVLFEDTKQFLESQRTLYEERRDDF